MIAWIEEVGPPHVNHRHRRTQVALLGYAAARVIDELDIGYVCARCDPEPPDEIEAARWLELGMPAELALALALAACARCMAVDGATIDRAHTERALASFGSFAEPLAPWLADRAVAARPELAGAARLVADVGALLIAPAESWRQRLERLVALRAPEVVVDDARRALARAEESDPRLEWERVYPWPAPGVFRGTEMFGAIACELAARVVPAMAPSEHRDIVEAIQRAASALALDEAALALRERLARDATGADRRARGLELAVRFLDELGHTGLRDNQDTLLDDAHFASTRHGLVLDLHRFWLEHAVPRAWRLAA